MPVILGGNTGIYLASLTPPAPPFTNQYSMIFDGVDECFNIANPASFSNTGDFSISAWVKYTTTGSLHILNIRDNRILYVNTGRIVGAYRNSSGSFTSITSPSLYNNNNWHHVLFVKNSTNLILFVDGTQVISNSSGGATQTGGSSFARISARALNATPTNYYNGLVDEIAFFQSDQSANISTIYNSGAPADLTSLSPLSWWRMGDGDTWGGTNWTLTDNGSGGNNATSVNMEEADRLPISPNSYSQNSFLFSSGKYFDIGNPASLQITGALTISVWIKLNSAGDTIIISKDDQTNRSWALWSNFAGGGTPRATLAIFNGGVIKTVSSTTELFDGGWHHIMAVYVPSTTMKIYIDGVLNAENTTSIPASIDNDPANILIGKGLGLPYYFNGNIDELYIWNNDQSANISTIYGNGVPTDISSLNPLGHWRMGENATWNGSTWTLTDQGSGNNDAVSVGMVEADKTGDQSYVI